MSLNSVFQTISILISAIPLMGSWVNSHPLVGNPMDNTNPNQFLHTSSPTRHFTENSNQEELESITTEERIASFGYPVEMQEVTTGDGYILTLHRIPHGRNYPSKKRKPVLLQHGGFGDSFSWFFNYPDKILALQLADQGYDVWIANARGTMYSRKHKFLTDHDKKFFDFSVDEIAQFDIPAQIDHILNATGEPTLIVVGISLGPAEIHAALSLFPEYNKKLSLVTSIAPTIYGSNTYFFAQLLNRFGSQSTITKTVLDLLADETGEFPPLWAGKIMRFGAGMGAKIGLTLCEIPFIRLVCKIVSSAVYGGPIHPDKMRTFPLAFGHAFAPISARLADQFIQWLKTERFQQYDFGESTNYRVYGTSRPPLYHLKDTTAPVAVFYHENDYYVNPTDVARTVSELPNVVLFHRVISKSWNHVDFLTGLNVNEVLNNHIIELFQKY